MSMAGSWQARIVNYTGLRHQLPETIEKLFDLETA